MSPPPDASASDQKGSRDVSQGPPAPTGDAFIDEVRAIKGELSARFDHDLEELGAHLKAVQKDIAQQEPWRIVLQSQPKP